MCLRNVRCFLVDSDILDQIESTASKVLEPLKICLFESEADGYMLTKASGLLPPTADGLSFWATFDCGSVSAAPRTGIGLRLAAAKRKIPPLTTCDRGPLVSTWECERGVLLLAQTFVEVKPSTRKTEELLRGRQPNRAAKSPTRRGKLRR